MCLLCAAVRAAVSMSTCQWTLHGIQAGLMQNAPMPDIASVLKVEIARLARKELRSETDGLKKTVASYRSEIAALKRRVQTLEKQGKRSAKAAAPAQQEDESSSTPRRFSATRLAAQRKKLGLSASDFAALLGVSGQSIYKWEQGESRPRARQLEAIAALRGVGKKEAALRLEQMKAR
jgi:DNA-binding transcriptional regulator YiaG